MGQLVKELVNSELENPQLSRGFGVILFGGRIRVNKSVPQVEDGGIKWRRVKSGGINVSTDALGYYGYREPMCGGDRG